MLLCSSYGIGCEVLLGSFDVRLTVSGTVVKLAQTVMGSHSKLFTSLPNVHFIVKFIQQETQSLMRVIRKACTSLTKSWPILKLRNNIQQN